MQIIITRRNCVPKYLMSLFVFRAKARERVVCERESYHCDCLLEIHIQVQEPFKSFKKT